MKNKINKIIGKNYLHSHTITEYVKGIDKEHCIVDRKDIEEVQKFFEDNPELIQWLGNCPIHRDFNTNRVVKSIDNYPFRDSSVYFSRSNGRKSLK